MTAQTHTVAFGRYRLFVDQRLLVRDRTPVPLGGRAFDILATLIECRQTAVSKHELMRRIWGSQVVEENTLSVHISLLRKALGGGTGGVEYIRRVPSRGYQFVAPVEEAYETPAASAEPLTGRLPRATTELIGRDDDLAAVAAALRSARLVTLTGPGGIGKSRLAIALGEQARPDFPDGVWWVDLAPISDLALVPATVAHAIGLPPGEGPPLRRLVDHLHRPRRLLILDNCEHVIQGVAELAIALREASGVTLLATSLEPLQVAGECIERLGPLAVPAHDVNTAAEALATPAVRMFVANMRASDAGFVLDEQSVAPVVRICRRLEGIPLALELAAARAALLGAEAVERQLEKRLLELSSGRRDVVAKHRTLRALLEWSHGLLTEQEQIVLRRLSAFAGGCALDAAEAVVADATVPEWRVAEHMASLIAKSLLVADRTEQGGRYRLLDTTQAFAAEQLRVHGEAAALAERHALYFTGLMEQADRNMETTQDIEWLRRYTPEIDNVRAALNWAFADPGRSRIAVALAAAASQLWLASGFLVEGRAYAERALALLDEGTPAATAALLSARAARLWANHDRPRSLPLAEQAVALYRALGDAMGLSYALPIVGWGYTYQGRNAEAEAIFEEACRIQAMNNFEKALSNSLTFRGILAEREGRVLEARSYYLHALELARKLNRPATEASCLGNLANIEWALGSVDRAIELTQEAIAVERRLGRRDLLVVGLTNLAWFHIVQDRPDAARIPAAEAFAEAREFGGMWLTNCLEQWAWIGGTEGRHEAAARLLGFTDAALARSGEVREADVQQYHDRLVQLLAAALPPEQLRARAAEGAEWTEEQAAAFAFATIITPGKEPPV